MASNPKYFTIQYCNTTKRVRVNDEDAYFNTNIPANIVFDGYGCKSYTAKSSCDWSFQSNDPNITVNPSTGAANVQYDVQICYNAPAKVSFKTSGGTYSLECTNDGKLDSLSLECEKQGIEIGSEELRTIYEATVGGCVKEMSYTFNGYGNTLSSVTLSEGIEVIGGYSFNNCRKLTGVTIPSSVREIGSSSFSYCTGLTRFVIPQTVKRVGYASLHGTNLTELTIPEGVEYLDSAIASPVTEAYRDDDGNWKSRVVGESVTSWHIPSSVTGVGITRNYEKSFIEYPITSYTVSTSNPVYDSRDNCNALIKTATNTLIEGCLTTTIPSSVTKIGGYAFQDQLGLQHFTIPSHITDIGRFVFESCQDLIDVTFEGATPPTINGSDRYLFSNCYSLEAIYVPSGSVEAYKAALPTWADLIKTENNTSGGGVGGAE